MTLAVGDLAEPVIAVAVRDLGQILLVNLFGVVELTGGRDLGRNFAEPRLI